MGENKPERESGVWRPMGGEGAAQRASGDEEDVEGHKFQPSGAQQRGVERGQQRAAQRGTPDEEDVEGHKFQPSGAQQRGVERGQQRAGEDEEDVEGHAKTR